MEHEEGRERCSQKKAQDQCSSDSGAERCVLELCYRVVLVHAWITDLTELDLPSTMKIAFADPADLLNFFLTITPDEGRYHASRTRVD